MESEQKEEEKGRAVATQGRIEKRERTVSTSSSGSNASKIDDF